MSKRTIHRSSVTGKLVTEQYARANPRTTETERVNVPSRPSPQLSRQPSKPRGKS